MLNAIYLYRAARFLYLHHLTFLSKIIELLIFVLYNSRIPSSSSIGKGTVFAYGGIGVVVHKRAVIGNNCIIGTNVTIGGRSGHLMVPVIGNNVDLSTGSKILGPITLGDNVIVGANAVVISSFASNSVLAGVPARLIKSKSINCIKLKVLITVPNLQLPGGVTGLYNSLNIQQKGKFEYFEVNYSNKSNTLVSFLYIILKFCFKIKHFDVIHLNPSLDKRSFIRDGLFAFIAKIQGKRILVYWHGWQDEFYHRVDQKWFWRLFYKLTFNCTNHQIVLANAFLLKIRSLGYGGFLTLESNAVDVKGNVEIDTRRNYREHPFRLLYISRIVVGKGWDLAIETMKIVSKVESCHIELLLCGDGPCLTDAKKLAESLNLTNVRFLGYVSGAEKEKAIASCDLCFFPTCYPEGMPMSILESAVVGLPIITRNEGGIKDHIVHGVNGYVLDSKDPQDFAKLIVELYENHELYSRMSKANIELGEEKFTREKFIERLFSYYDNLVSK